MPGIRTSLRNAGRRILRIAVTVAFLGFSMLAAFWGANLMAERAAAVAAPPRAPLTPVAIAEVKLQPGYVVTRRFIGQVEAPGRIDLGFELGGRIVEILAQEGDRVPRGAPLARLDIAALEAQRIGGILLRHVERFAPTLEIIALHGDGPFVFRFGKSKR
jgi:multidrug efflux pump subunit AcrA (membrane-fusion protein)